MVEFSWFKAILLKDAVVFDETEPERFLEVLAEFELGDVESMQPMRRRVAMADSLTDGTDTGLSIASEPPPSPPATAVAAMLATGVAKPPARQAVTVHVLESTRTKMEEQANSEGLSLGGLLDRLFGGGAE
jgi:hypothetical protein